MGLNPITLFPLILKTIAVHTVTYFIAGVLALVFLDYGEIMGTEDSIFRPITDPIVMAGPLFQPIRGILFGLAIYLIRTPVFDTKLGWLKLWWIFIALGVLSTFGPAPGSVEAMIYTNLELSVITYIEVLFQALVFSIILIYWVNNHHLKWLNWTMWIGFAIAMILPILGLISQY